jgi:hypothetical protein
MESKRGNSIKTTTGCVESYTREEEAEWMKAADDRRDYAKREGMYFCGEVTAWRAPLTEEHPPRYRRSAPHHRNPHPSQMGARQERWSRPPTLGQK